MSLHADEGNGFPLTRLHHFPAVLRATNLQLPVAVILSSTIYTKLDAITLIKAGKSRSMGTPRWQAPLLVPACENAIARQNRGRHSGYFQGRFLP